MHKLAEELVNLLIEKNLKISTAESCTGGLLAAVITDVPNASKCFETGFITYSPESKIFNLKVSSRTIISCGTICEQTAREMAEGAKDKANSNVSIAITGVAGPESYEDNDVGLVFIAIYYNHQTFCQKFNFSGSRQEIRESAVKSALQMVLDSI